MQNIQRLPETMKIIDQTVPSNGQEAVREVILEYTDKPITHDTFILIQIRLEAINRYYDTRYKLWMTHDGFEINEL